MTGRTRFGSNIIDTEQLYDDCITQPKIGPQAIGTTELTDDGVTADKIAAGVISHGGRVDRIYANVDLHTGNATIPIGTIPGGSLITEAIAVCVEAAPGTGTLTVGYTTAVDVIFADANITKTLAAVSGQLDSEHGSALFSTVKKTLWIAADTIVNAYVVKGDNTVGHLDVYIWYLRGVQTD